MRTSLKIAIGAVVFGVVLVAIILPGDTAQHAKVAPPEPAPDDGVGDRFHGNWNVECPAGTALRGGPPPDDYQIWCERPDGTRHGPHVSWWPNSRKAFARHYTDGRLDGPFEKWGPDGQRIETGQYDEGRRTGRWVRWSDLGAAEITDY